MRYLIFIWMTGVFLFSADVSLWQSDFIERTINFVIFIAILWYLSASKIRMIFTQRRRKIEQAFEKIQSQEKELKKIKETKEASILEAKNKANEIISDAKKEAFVIAQSFDMRLKQDVKTLGNTFDAMLEREKKQIIQEEIERIVQESFASLSLKSDDYLRILEKGVRCG